MRRFLLAAALGACAAPAPPKPPIAPPPPAVLDAAPAPASPPAPVATVPSLRLPRAFTPSAYAARLAIDPDKPAFEGSIAIDGAIAEATNVIWLHGYHLTIHTAKATHDGASVALTVTPHGEELLELHSDAPLQPGAWQLALDYTGQIDPFVTLGAFKESTGGHSYVFTQFESIGARRVFPCLDEPDSKVPWTLTLDVPAADLAVANTPAARDGDLGGGVHRYEFAPTQPLPSYLVAFGIGPFDVVPAGKTKSGVPVRVIAPKGRAADASYAAQMTARVLDELEAWFGIPYAFGKLDVMAIPLTSGFGAMENAGLVTFAENLILLDPQHPSWANRERYVEVAAHELAHQWFGDLVTTAWWDDIWLNEGFANWMETKIVAKIDPSWHAELQEIEMRRRAQVADSLVTARRVRQPIENENDILNSFDGITYDKGASVLRMFEAYVGPDVFQRGVRAYLKSKSFGNATSADFIAAVSQASGKDLAPAFATFLDRAGLPQLSFELMCGTGKPRVAIAQHRFVGSTTFDDSLPWTLPVCVAYEAHGGRGQACALVDARTAELELPITACPRWIAPNAGGRGYYRADLSVRQAAALRDEAWSQLTPAERLVTFFDVMTSATEPHVGERLPLQLALSFVPRLLAAGDRFSIASVADLADRLRTYTAADQRPKLEFWLRDTFGPGIAKLGLLPKPGDDLDAEATRARVFEAAAYAGRDPELAKQAIELAGHWRELPEAMRGAILAVAADASPDVQAELLRAVDTEKDVKRLNEALGALAGVRDATRLDRALGAMLDPAVDFRRSMWMLQRVDSEATATAEAFVKTHQAALLARLPKIDDTGSSVRAFMAPFVNDCDPAHRDDIAAYMKQTFSAIPGAPRQIAQHIERLDRCIAAHAALEPDVRGWLGGIKIAKPKSKK